MIGQIFAYDLSILPKNAEKTNTTQIYNPEIHEQSLIPEFRLLLFQSICGK